MVASASSVLGISPVLLPDVRMDAVGISSLLSSLGILPSLGLAAPLVVIGIEPLSDGAHPAGRSAT